MLENLIKDTKAKISQFIDCDKVEVKVVGNTLEVTSGGWQMFLYNFREARTVFGMPHKMGFTPGRLMDLTDQLKAVV